MRYAVKNKRKIVKAYQLGADTEMERQLIKEGVIHRKADGRYELFSQEAKDGIGQLADEGDYFKVDTVEGKHYPYNNTKEWFEENHVHLTGDKYEQKPKPVQIWEADDPESEEIAYLLASGKLVVNKDDEERYFNAELWGAPLSAEKDAVVIIYSAKKDGDGIITDIDFCLVTRKDFEESYTVVEKKTKHHVLIMALSTFFNANKQTETTSYVATKYRYYDRSLQQDKKEPASLYEYNGHYQMEPIPKFIIDYKGESVTDMILLETKEVKTDSRADLQMSAKDKDGNEIACPACYKNITAEKYFHDWVKREFGDEIRIIPIDVNPQKPLDAFSEVLDQVKKLYKEITDRDDWRLWIDTHGGYRGISDVLVSSAKFFATDDNQPIPTNDIYTVFHSQEKNTPDEIVVQTAYYLAESAELMRRFLNYGQYLYEAFAPCGDDKPYAFISYRHQPEHYVNIQNLFTHFKKANVPFWYDEGIHYGENWRQVLESRNQSAAVFVGLLSNSYFESAECWKELIQAVSYRKGNAAVSEDANHWCERMHFVLLEKGIVIPAEEDDLPLNSKDKEIVTVLMKQLEVTWEDIASALRFNENGQLFKYFDFTDEDALAAKTPTNPQIQGWIEQHIKPQLETTH